MGFFNRETVPVPSQLAPLSEERLVAALKAEELIFGYDSDYDVYASFENGVFYFLRVGEQREMLQVHAVYRRNFDPEHLPRLQLICESVNRDKLLPKVYPMVAESKEGTVQVRVAAEYVVDYEAGVSDEQLRVHIRTALGATLGFFKSLDDEFGINEADGEQQEAAEQ